MREYKNIGEKLIYKKLGNGLDVFIVPKEGFVNSYAFFATKYGSIDTRFNLAGQWHETPAGVAHFLEHKMFDKKDFNALSELSKNGASPNAFTSFDMTAYHFESPSLFERNLEILLDMVSVPYFTPESVNKEQGIIAQEIKMYEDSPNWRVLENLASGLFYEHPVRVNIAGTVESISHITSETLYACHEAFYTPSNMVLVVTGDVDPQKIYDIAEKNTKKEPGIPSQRDYGREDFQSSREKEISINMEISQPMFLQGFKAAPPEPGEASLKRRLLGDLAAQTIAGKSSPLYSKLYSEGLINSGFECEYMRFSGGGCLVLGGESKNPRAVCEAFFKEAGRVIKEGFDESLFKRLKKAAFGAHLNALNNFERICYEQTIAHFEGACYFDFPQIYNNITAADAASFIKDMVIYDKSAFSEIRPN